MDEDDDQSALMESIQIDTNINTNTITNTISLNPGIFQNYKKNINMLDIIIISIIAIAIIITIIYVLA